MKSLICHAELDSVSSESKDSCLRRNDIGVWS